MERQRCLIVNADDFGKSEGVNRGIIRAYEQGIVTSTSLMVRWPAAAAAAEYARQHPDLDLGLHVDLGEWAFCDGNWVAVYEVVPPGDVEAVTGEIERQLEQFRALTGSDPSHLDSHQHVHRRAPAHAVLRRLAEELGVPLRQYSQVQYCGRFYGQTTEGASYPEALTVENLQRIFGSLTAGVTELCCHPGEIDDLLRTAYRAERQQELSLLCDPRVRQLLAAARITLCSFGDVARWAGGSGRCEQAPAVKRQTAATA